MWLLSSTKVIRSSSFLIFSLILFSRSKFAHSLAENFSLIINTINCHQLDIYKPGTFARVYTLYKQAESILLAYTILSNFAHRYRKIRVPGVYYQKNSYLKGRIYIIYISNRSPIAFSKKRILFLYIPDYYWPL